MSEEYCWQGGQEAVTKGRSHEFMMPEGGIEIDVQVSNESGTVTGRVLDDKDNPVPNARVLFSGDFVPTMTDQFGNFRMEGIPSGRHEFFACAGRVERVEVAANATASVTLRECAKP